MRRAGAGVSGAVDIVARLDGAGDWLSEISWTMSCTDGNTYSGRGNTNPVMVTVVGGLSCNIEMRDSWGDGWNGNSLLIGDLHVVTLDNGPSGSTSISFPAPLKEIFTSNPSQGIQHSLLLDAIPSMTLVFRTKLASPDALTDMQALLLTSSHVRIDTIRIIPPPTTVVAFEREAPVLPSPPTSDPCTCLREDQFTAGSGGRAGARDCEAYADRRLLPFALEAAPSFDGTTISTTTCPAGTTHHVPEVVCAAFAVHTNRSFTVSSSQSHADRGCKVEEGDAAVVYYADPFYDASACDSRCVCFSEQGACIDRGDRVEFSANADAECADAHCIARHAPPANTTVAEVTQFEAELMVTVGLSFDAQFFEWSIDCSISGVHLSSNDLRDGARSPILSRLVTVTKGALHGATQGRRLRATGSGRRRRVSQYVRLRYTRRIYKHGNGVQPPLDPTDHGGRQVPRSSGVR